MWMRSSREMCSMASRKPNGLTGVETSSKAKDQTYHLFVCRWREDHPKGHMAWHQSEVVRAVSKNRLGPYKVAEVIGPGHNPEVYRLKDGRYVCYVIECLLPGHHA